MTTFEEREPFGPLPPVPPPPGYALYPPPPRRSRRRPLLVVTGLVATAVLVGVGVVGWQLLSREVRFTLDGRTVTTPAAALQAAEGRSFTFTSSRLVNRGSDDHCYFAVADGGSDIAQGIYCGPIALTDSAGSANFLHYEITGALTAGHETITVAGDPDGAQTEPLPVGYSLMRPGDSVRHRHFDRVANPVPTSAAANVIVTADAVGTGSSRTKGHNPFLVGRSAALSVEELQTIPYYGSGTGERSPAAGQQLIAFKLMARTSGAASSLDQLGLTVTVDGRAAVPLPSVPDDAHWVVVSVPLDAHQVVLTLPGPTGPQTVSLLDGSLGSNNVDASQRTNLHQTLSRTITMPATFTTADGTADPTTLHFQLKQAQLDYTVNLNNGKQIHPSDPSTLWLHLDLSYTDDARPGKTYGELGSPLQELRLPDGSILQPANVSTDGGTFYAYIVPTTFTTGTLILGAGTRHFDDGGTESFGHQLEIPLSIPLD